MFFDLNPLHPYKEEIFHVRIEKEWDSFLPVLNHGMEAVQLKREVISLSDEEMKKEQYAHYHMAVIRTPALRELRELFVGRVIHRFLDSWKKSVLSIIDKSSASKLMEGTLQQKFCTGCGTKLTGGMSFCGECGKKICEKEPIQRFTLPRKVA
ncbi:MAG: zinc ribbon domain-containing protein [Eubacteriales bacterium]|nr:zinc ribbon domain-containing protein [Eubacteriales bacterium]